MAAMLVAPLLALVTLSFWTQNGFEIDRSFTLANYWTMIEPADEPTMWMGIPFPFENPVYAILMLKSLVMSLAVTAAVILIAYPMAYFLAFRVTRYKALWIISSPFRSGPAICCASFPGRSCWASTAPSTPA